jgi:type II secretory pathway component GspD/PulD (secretin)
MQVSITVTLNPEQWASYLQAVNALNASLQQLVVEFQLLTVELQRSQVLGVQFAKPKEK